MTIHRSRRRVRPVALAALGMLAGSTLLTGSAQAQTDPATDAPAAALGGFEGLAHSSGVHTFYNPEGLLPTAAVLDAGSPDAMATISSGPVTFARASAADPGDLLVNPDALLTQADPSYPGGTLPAYPFRISANSTVGEPVAESKPAPGLDARVEATDTGSTARSRTAAASAPGVASAGSVDATATSSFDGTAVQVHARTEVSGFDLLGLLEIESIVTDVVARSDGGDVTVGGGTVITGATFMDAPVIIDEDGMRTDPEAESPDVPLLGAVREATPAEVLDALHDAGLRVTLPGPVAQDGETAGTFASTGLRIDFELSERTAPILGDIASLIPPLDNPIPGAPSVADALVLVQAQHLAALDVGRARVALTARPAFVPPPFEAATPSVSPSVGATPAPSLSPPIARSTGPAAPSVAAPPTGSVNAAPAATEVPAASLAAGIGALALLALLVQPVFGDRLARMAGAVLATGPTDTCPLEVR